MNKLFALIILCTCNMPVTMFAQTNLSGSIGGMTLEKGGNPFIVSENVTIPAGKSVTILDSCIFLFKPFTGIIIEGTLEVKGTLENPVVFTSVNNPIYNKNAPQPPDPFDWNGIVVETKAKKLKMSNFNLSYSVYGIKSNRDDIIISTGNFSNNGQFHFTIHDEIQPVSDHIPYNYQPQTDVAPVQLIKLSVQPWKRPVAIITALTGCAGYGGAGYFYLQKKEYRKKYLAAETLPEHDRYTKKQETALLYAWIAGVSGTVLFGTGVLLFSVDLHDRSEVALSIAPIIGTLPGMAITVDLPYHHKRIGQ